MPSMAHMLCIVTSDRSWFVHRWLKGWAEQWVGGWAEQWVWCCVTPADSPRSSCMHLMRLRCQRVSACVYVVEQNRVLPVDMSADMCVPTAAAQACKLLGVGCAGVAPYCCILCCSAVCGDACCTCAVLCASLCVVLLEGSFWVSDACCGGCKVIAP